MGSPSLGAAVGGPEESTSRTTTTAPEPPYPSFGMHAPCPAHDPNKRRHFNNSPSSLPAAACLQGGCATRVGGDAGTGSDRANVERLGIPDSGGTEEGQLHISLLRVPMAERSLNCGCLPDAQD